MKDNVKIGHTVSTLMDIVDTLINAVDCSIRGNYYTNPEKKVLDECKEVMKNLKHDWQDEF